MYRSDAFNLNLMSDDKILDLLEQISGDELGDTDEEEEEEEDFDGYENFENVFGDDFVSNSVEHDQNTSESTSIEF